MNLAQQKRVNIALIALVCAIALFVAGFAVPIGSFVTEVSWSSSVILIIVAAILSFGAALPAHRGSVFFLVAGLLLAASVVVCIDALPLIEGVWDIDQFLPVWGFFVGSPLALIFLGIGRAIASPAKEQRAKR